jgi:tRNA modification GTPase
VIGDTIFAVASPPGPAARGILRVSGPVALPLAASVLGAPLPRRRAQHERAVRIGAHDVPCLVLVMPAPRAYTGEDVAELHLPGSPLLLERVAERLREHARDATPGEFTRRALEHGRVDLAGAEATGALIHAASAAERRATLAVLGGVLQQEVGGVRATIQDALAAIEAGLDFTDGETGALEPAAALPALARARAALVALAAALPQARTGGELLLLGAASAGKSSLANALAGRDAVLVGEAPGTTRDVVAVPLPGGAVLLDAPGDSCGPGDGVDVAARALRDRVAARAGGALLVVDASSPAGVPVLDGPPAVAVAFTKCDLAAPPAHAGAAGVPAFATSARTGAGIAALRAWLAARAAAGAQPGLGRVAAHLRAAAAHLDDARAALAAGGGGETVALDLAAALEQLDAVHGRSSPEDLLDRIFATFCLGK